MASPRDIASNLVDAQQARRALDYLVGFNLSPVLWRKVQRGLSAGRVQSPALRMIVEREEEIEAFVAREYWSVEAECAHPVQAFTAKLTRLDGKKFEQFTVTDGDTAEQARRRIVSAANGALHVTDVASKERKRRPAAPFTTSTLQQEASRKLGFTTRRTMQVAPKLYEGVAIGEEGTVGLISYMRTDSGNLSAEALGEIRDVLARAFGTKGVPAPDGASEQRRPAPAAPLPAAPREHEASSKRGGTARRTRQGAQKLYEGVAVGEEGTVGLISYMRTDAVNLSAEALGEIRDGIARDFGTKALPDKPNFYTTKSKNAQEAHEAVRPTSALRTPAQVARFLSDDERDRKSTRLNSSH